MKRLVLTLALLSSASIASAANLSTELVLLKFGATTNPLIYDGAYDVYSIVATNPNATPVIALDLKLTGSFLQLGIALEFGGIAFVSGPENPSIFGFELPDTFFSLPESADATSVIGLDIIDTGSQLSGSYSLPNGAALVPARGSAPIMTVSVPTGEFVTIPFILGRADIGGRTVCIGCLPEPSAALLAGIGLVGVAGIRRPADGRLVTERKASRA